MSADEQLLTPEQTLQKVLEYLKSRADEPGTDSRPFTPAGISRATGISREHVQEALSVLVEKKRLLKASLNQDVYFPANSAGRRVQKELQASRPTAVHLAVVVIVAIVGTLIAISSLDLYLGYDGPDPNVVAAQKAAFGDGMLFAVLCVLLGVALKAGLDKLFRWQFDSEVRYRQAVTFTKYAGIAAAIGLIGYWIVARALKQAIDWGIGVAVAGVLVGAVLTYFVFARKPISRVPAEDSAEQ